MEKHFPMRDFIEEEAPPEKAFSLHKYERTPYMLALIGSAFLLLGIMSLAGLTEIGKSWWYWPAFGCFLAATITYYQRNQANKEEMSKRDVKRDTIDPRTSGKSVEKNPPKSQELQETRDERFSFCPYCGGSISELAVYCPFCGHILKD